MFFQSQWPDLKRSSADDDDIYILKYWQLVRRSTARSYGRRKKYRQLWLKCRTAQNPCSSAPQNGQKI